MATSKRVEGKTPNGGDYSEVYFQDNSGESVEEEEATRAEVVEYTKGGEQVWRTYMRLSLPDDQRGGATDAL